MKIEDFDTGYFVDELQEIDPCLNDDIEVLEKKYKCEISCSIEKHNVLQYTYYYEIDFGLEENLFIEIESGINNGTQINSEQWGYDTKTNTKVVSVLTDIVLDMDFYKEGYLTTRKAEAVLSANKNKLFEWHRQNSYDNYVTGGNSKMKTEPLLSQLHLNYIYEEKEVDRIFK